MAAAAVPCDRQSMPIEDKIRSVGTKSLTYPWMRRYVVIGPYNRHVRQDAAASILARAITSARDAARRRRTPPKSKTG